MAKTLHFRGRAPLAGLLLLFATALALAFLAWKWIDRSDLEVSTGNAISRADFQISYVGGEPESPGPNLYLLNADGSGLRQVTSGIYVYVDAVWSPDGERLAFTSGLDAPLHIVNADGTGLRVLTEVHGGQASWSPDGTRVAFQGFSKGEGNSQILVINADGSELRALTNGEYPADGPVWSPNGDLVAFVDSQNNVRTIRPDGSNPRSVNGISAFEGPSWSPDGERLVFLGGRRLTEEPTIKGPTWAFDIYVAASDGSDLIQVTNSASQESHVIWFPDGTRIAFRDLSDGHIYTIKPDGSALQRLTVGDSPTNDYFDYPAWSPDGTLLAVFQSRQLTGDSFLSVMNADGTDLRRITDLSMPRPCPCYPRWRPQTR